VIPKRESAVTLYDRKEAIKRKLVELSRRTAAAIR